MTGRRPATAFLKEVNEKKGGIYGLKKESPSPGMGTIR